MPATHGILETALYVRDLNSAAGFYCQLFGATTLLESERLIALGLAGRSVLLLFKEGTTGESVDTPGGTIPHHRGAGPTHFAVLIDEQDLDDWKQRLLAQSVAIESTVSWPGGVESIYFRDPDQNLVELMTHGFWQGIDGRKHE